MFRRVQSLVGGTHNLREVLCILRQGKVDADSYVGRNVFAHNLCRSTRSVQSVCACHCLFNGNPDHYNRTARGEPPTSDDSGVTIKNGVWLSAVLTAASGDQYHFEKKCASCGRPWKHQFAMNFAASFVENADHEVRLVVNVFVTKPRREPLTVIDGC
jgi:hypothetical protein